MNYDDFFEVQVQPECAKEALLKYQKKYNIHTSWVVFVDKLLSDIDGGDLADWIFEFNMFRMAGGNLKDLYNGGE